MRVTLRRGNDQVVSLLGLRTSDAYLNAATVKATLYDSRGDAIPAFTDVSMAYVPDSDGTYEWHINGAIMMLPKNVEYTLEIRAVQESLRYRDVHVVTVTD